MSDLDALRDGTDFLIREEFTTDHMDRIATYLLAVHAQLQKIDTAGLSPAALAHLHMTLAALHMAAAHSDLGALAQATAMGAPGRY